MAAKLKFAWHVHHGVLVEPLLEPIEERIAYIKLGNYPPRNVQAASGTAKRFSRAGSGGTDMNGFNRNCIFASLDKPDAGSLWEWAKAAFLVALFIGLLLASGGEG